MKTAIFSIILLSSFIISKEIISSENKKSDFLIKNGEIEEKLTLNYFYNDSLHNHNIFDDFIFKNRIVADYLKDNFLATGLNIADPGTSPREIYLFNSLGPHAIVNNAEGKTIAWIKTIGEPGEFLLDLKQIKNDYDSYLLLKRIHEAIGLSKDSLFEFCYITKKVNEDFSKIVNDYLNSLSNDEFNIDKNLQFLLDFQIRDVAVFPINSKAFQFLKGNWHKLAKVSNFEFAKTRMAFLLKTYIEEAFKNGDEAKLIKACELLKPFERAADYYYFSDTADKYFSAEWNFENASFEYKMSFFSEFSKEKFIQEAENIATTGINDAEMLYYIANQFFMHNKEKPDLELAKKWIAKSCDLSYSTKNCLLYAEILYMLEEYELAVSWLEKAYLIDSADKRGSLYSRKIEILREKIGKKDMH